jgi:hypothetical protein
MLIAIILDQMCPFPQPWGVLMVAAISITVQLAAPWTPAHQRTKYKKKAAALNAGR